MHWKNITILDVKRITVQYSRYFLFFKATGEPVGRDKAVRGWQVGVLESRAWERTVTKHTLPWKSDLPSNYKRIYSLLDQNLFLSTPRDGFDIFLDLGAKDSHAHPIRVYSTAVISLFLHHSHSLFAVLKAANPPSNGHLCGIGLAPTLRCCPSRCVPELAVVPRDADRPDPLQYQRRPLHSGTAAQLLQLATVIAAWRIAEIDGVIGEEWAGQKGNGRWYLLGDSDSLGGRCPTGNPSSCCRVL